MPFVRPHSQNTDNAPGRKKRNKAHLPTRYLTALVGPLAGRHVIGA